MHKRKFYNMVYNALNNKCTTLSKLSSPSPNDDYNLQYSGADANVQCLWRDYGDVTRRPCGAFCNELTVLSCVGASRRDSRRSAWSTLREWAVSRWVQKWVSVCVKNTQRMLGKLCCVLYSTVTWPLNIHIRVPPHTHDMMEYVIYVYRKIYMYSNSNQTWIKIFILGIF